MKMRETGEKLWTDFFACTHERVRPRPHTCFVVSPKRSTVGRASGWQSRSRSWTCTWPFDPVKPVGVEQDEVDDRKGNQNATGIKQKPNTMHDLSPLAEQILCQHGSVLHGVLQFGVTVDCREPRTPIPNEEVGDDCNQSKANESRHKDTVKFLSLLTGQTGQGRVIISH
jgi:hypothetical protein